MYNPSKIRQGDYHILTFGPNISIKYNHKEFIQMITLHILSAIFMLILLTASFIYLVIDFGKYESFREVILRWVPSLIMSIIIIGIALYYIFCIMKKISPPGVIQLYQFLYYFNNKNRKRDSYGTCTSCTYSECNVRFINKYNERVFIKIDNPMLIVEGNNKSKKYHYEINFGYENQNHVIIIKK